MTQILEMLVNTSQLKNVIMENASGREPFYKNVKPYVVSALQRKEDSRVGGPFPMTKKAKCILFDFINYRVQLTFLYNVLEAK